MEGGDSLEKGLGKDFLRGEDYMKTNELKREDRIQLRNGWYGTVKDNMKGDRRICEVEGFYTETGSVFSHDIAYFITPEGKHVPIEHTDAQKKLRVRIEAFSKEM